MNRKTIRKFSYAIVLLGAIGLGIDGFLKINLISSFFGSSGVGDIAKIFIGLSGLFILLNYNPKSSRKS